MYSLRIGYVTDECGFALLRVAHIPPAPPLPSRHGHRRCFIIAQELRLQLREVRAEEVELMERSATLEKLNVDVRSPCPRQASCMAAKLARLHGESSNAVGLRAPSL